MKVLGVPVSERGTSSLFVKDLERSLGRNESFLVTFVNPSAVSICIKNSEYLESLLAFDRVLCDGIGMVYAARRFGYQLDRLSFDATSIAPVALSMIAKQSVDLYLVGSSPGVALHAANVFLEKYQGLRIKNVFSGYGADLDRSIEEISKNGFSVVIAGLGSAIQESYLLRLRGAGWNGIGFTCGGYFDQVGINDKYYPDWVNMLNIRFAYRLFKEPKRLARRYSFDYFPFVSRYFLTFFKSIRQ